MRVVAVMFVALVVPALHAQGQLPYQNPVLPPAQRATDLVGRMTLEEKALQSPQIITFSIDGNQVLPR